MRNFDWGNTLERAVWTSLQVPAVVAVLDSISALDAPASAIIWSAVGGFVISAVKTVGQERLRYLRGGDAENG